MCVPVGVRGFTAVDVFFFFQAEDGIRDYKVTGVQTCALPIWYIPPVFHEAATYDKHFVKPRSGGLLLLRRITPLPRRNAVYFCSGAYRIQLARREELMPAGNLDIRFSRALLVFAETRRIDRVMRFGVNTVPPQDVIASSPDEDMSQQVWQLPFTVIDTKSILSYQSLA